MAGWGLQQWFALMLIGSSAMALWAVVRRQAVWLLSAAFFAGTSAQLGVTQPMWFGSLEFGTGNRFKLICFAVIAVQAAVTAMFLARAGRIGGLRSGIASVGYKRVLLLLALLLLATVSPMGFIHFHQYGAFAKQFVASGTFLSINIANLLALGLLLPQSFLLSLAGRIDRLFSVGEAQSSGAKPLLLWLAALWVFAVTMLLNLFAFDRIARIPDEVAYLFQAKYFAQGHLYALMPSGPIAAALQYDWISMSDGKWFSIFPPGWPAVLAIGVAAGVPFLVNPLLAALTVPVSYSLTLRVGSPKLAVLVTLLLCGSPWYLATGASLMSHTLTMLLVLSGWWLMLEEGKRRPLAWFAAGCLMGFLFLTRPLDGVIVGTLTGVWAMSRVRLTTVKGWGEVAAFGFGCLVVGALIFPYNQLLVGNALVTPIDHHFDLLWHPGANRLGFGTDIGAPDNWGGIDIWQGHSPLEALIQSQFNLKMLNVELFGWAVGSLLPLFVHLIWGKLSRFDIAMLAVTVVAITAYALYWFNGGFYIGPRYWFMGLWPCVYLSARGLRTGLAVLKAAGLVHARETIATVAILLGALALVSFLPWRGITKYWEFRGSHSGYRDQMASGKPHNALVFVKSDNMSEYAGAFMLNEPDLKGVIFVKDRGQSLNAPIMAQYPGRSVYFMADKATIVKSGR